MCKVMIKKVEKILKGKSGEKDGKPWTLSLFQCVVEVDECGKDGSRLIKTFDAGIAKQISMMDDGAAPLVFEAKKQGEEAPFSYLLEPERSSFRNRGGKGGTEPFGPTNRQCCLRVAVELERARSEATGDVPTAADILRTADELLGWLEAGK